MYNDLHCYIASAETKRDWLIRGQVTSELLPATNIKNKMGAKLASLKTRILQI